MSASPHVLWVVVCVTGMAVFPCAWRHTKPEADALQVQLTENYHAWRAALPKYDNWESTYTYFVFEVSEQVSPMALPPREVL